MRAAVAVLLVLCTSRPADACIPAFHRAIVGRPVFEPADAVTVLGEGVDVQCDARRECTVAWTFEVGVAMRARASVTGYHTTELTISVDGAILSATVPGGSARDLAPTDKRFVVRARVQLPEYIDACFTDGILARHPYVGSQRRSDQRVLEIQTAAPLRVTQPSSWSREVDKRDATTDDPALTRVWFTVPGRLITNGGPFLFVGGVAGDGGGFHARGGWEVAVAKPWLVVALAGETDFADKWNVALTAEPVNRAWILP